MAQDSTNTVAAPLAPHQRFSGKSAAASVQWSAVAIVGKQVFMLAGAIVLARILGPNQYGVISAAMIYVTLSALLLDQGMSAALIQRKRPSPFAPGMAATMNLVAGVVLGGLTYVLAPAMASFLNNGHVTTVLRILGVGLMLKALAVAPRAMLSRTLRFKPIAITDISGAFAGMIAGIVSAELGAGYHAILYQTIVTDAIVAVLLLRAAHGPRPNLRVHELRTLLPFGARVFVTNAVAYFSRNIDNILVARYLGTLALSFYAMAYRVLVIPVQMLGQTVNRVLFPVFSRQAHRPDLVGQTMLSATEMLAIVTLPLMTALACSAHELVLIGLGHQWLPTVPLIRVLSIAGARETIFYITPSLMMAMGRADMLLRFEFVSTAVQVAGIVIGLQFSEFGVALGFTIAGFCITPLMLFIQRKLTAVNLRRQLLALWPAVHSSAWASAAYLALRMTHWPSLLLLGVGLPLFAAVYAGVLFAVHRRAVAGTMARLRLLVPGANRAPAAEVVTP